MKIKLSKNQWEAAGKKQGWIKQAQVQQQPSQVSQPKPKPQPQPTQVESDLTKYVGKPLQEVARVSQQFLPEEIVQLINNANNAVQEHIKKTLPATPPTTPPTTPPATASSKTIVTKLSSADQKNLRGF